MVPCQATGIVGPSHHSAHTVANTNVAKPTANARHFLRGSRSESSTSGNNFIAAAKPHSTAARSFSSRTHAHTPTAVKIHTTSSMFPWCTNRAIGNDIAAMLSGKSVAVHPPRPACRSHLRTHQTNTASQTSVTAMKTSSGWPLRYIGAITAAANGGYATGEYIGYAHGLPATLKKNARVCSSAY